MAIFFCVAPRKLPIAKISRANKKSNNDNYVDEFKSPYPNQTSKIPTVIV